MAIRSYGLAVAVLAGVPAAAAAQHHHGADKTTIHGYPYGPRVAPAWSYPGLPGGPFVAYPAFPPRSGLFHHHEPLGPNVGVVSGFGPGFGYGGLGYPGFFGFPGRIGNQWTNGLSAYGPPVPVYGPIPGALGNTDLRKAYQQHPGLAGYGWVGVYAASPRPKHPSVSVYPTVERVGPAPAVAAPATPAAPAAGQPGGCLVVSVKVPQPAAEVLVDGQKTAQTGTDRVFESPPLEGGRAYTYTVVARWVERGQVVEVSRSVTGSAGEVARVDFTTGK